MTLKDKTLFVSGGSRGIGLEIARRAARDGANVALIAKTGEPDPRLAGTVYTAAEQIEAAGGHALPIVGDIRDESAVAGAVAATVERFGGIDVCVNNASAINLSGTEALEMKRYDLMQDINTRGTFVVSRACIPHLRRAENPHILTLSPPISLEPRWLGPHIAYTIAKYGMTLCALGFAAEAAGGRDRVQRAVAADADRDRRGAEPARRRRGDGRVAQAAVVRGRRLRGHHPSQPRMHRQCVPMRGRPRRGRRHRFRRLRVRRGRDAASRPVRGPPLKRCGRVAQCWGRPGQSRDRRPQQPGVPVAAPASPVPRTSATKAVHIDHQPTVAQDCRSKRFPAPRGAHGVTDDPAARSASGTSISLAHQPSRQRAGRGSSRCAATWRADVDENAQLSEVASPGVTGDAINRGNGSGSRASSGGRAGAALPRGRGPVDRRRSPIV